VTPGAVEVGLADGVRALFVGTANLAHHAGDPADVPDARRRLERDVGVPVAFATQVHGADVHVVEAPLGPLPADVAVADALVTTRDDVALGVLVADCVPVLLAEPRAGVVGTAHAGRRGVVADVVGRALDAMVRLGARPGDVRAVVGPAACGRGYEVPAGRRDAVAAVVPAAVSTTSWGTPALDLPGAVVDRLRRAGVVVRHVEACTVEDGAWFSHRGATGGSRPPGAPAERPDGRFAGVVRRVPRVARGASAVSG